MYTPHNQERVFHSVDCHIKRPDKIPDGLCEDKSVARTDTHCTRNGKLERRGKDGHSSRRIPRTNTVEFDNEMR